MWPNKIKYALILIMGLAISAYMFYSINDKYVMRNSATIESDLFKVQLKLARELEKINLTLESMSVFIENSPNLNTEVFREFTTPVIDELYGLNLLLWAPSDGNSSPDPSVKKYPVQLVSPDSLSPGRIGYELYTNDSLRIAIDRSIATRKISYSSTFKNPKSTPFDCDLLALQAVFDSTSSDVLGIVIAEFEMDQLISKTLSFELAHMYINLYDTYDPGALLFAGIPGDENGYAGKIKERIRVNAADRIWELILVPKEQYLAYPHAFESYFVLMLGLITTVLLIMVVRQRDEYSQRLTMEVAFRTAELEESNKLKENLLREIHHRVKNNLQIASSLMNMQKRTLVSPEAISAIENSQARILAIALTHQKIYQDKDSKAVNLKDYLNDLVSYQRKFMPQIKCIIESPEVSVDLDRAVPLALITSELVTNAFKHAFTDMSKDNKLEITVSSLENNTVQIVIRDNGVGLGSDFDIQSTSGLGFNIIHSLCRQISASLRYFNDRGASFEITFENKV